VADTGNGLTPDQLERLFVPFERLGVDDGEIEGTGLGLALSKRLAEAMHASLEVESEPSVGTTFALELTREQAPRLDAAAAGGRQVPEREENGRTTVLYIEDNLANLRLVEEILSRRPQVRLLAAMQGGLGLELAEQHRPELIVLDLHLPDMHGTEVLARLRSDPATARTPVVVLSADATAGQIERLLGAGAAAYLTKPLDVRRFLELIDEHTSRAEVRPGSEREGRPETWAQRR
jgi:CheY-like chemotaxis protein